MSKESSSGERTEIMLRLQSIAGLIGRELPPYPPPATTPKDHRLHLLEEAQQLYENELAWEEETGEESTGSGSVVALVFPGTLALVDALLTAHPAEGAEDGGEHPDVVAAFLDWLQDRLLKLRSGEVRGSATDRAKEVDLTDRLIDLVIHRYCGLSAAEIERVDATRN